MQTIFQPISTFVKSQDFFWYHGYGLTTLWVVASTIAILAKKINLYLHALLFFIIDVTTVLMVGGAIYKYWDRFGQWQEWTLVKQAHIFGGTYFYIMSGIIVLAIVLLQHVGGVSAILSQSKRNPQHKRFAFWVANLARVVVVLGWIMKGGDTSNLLYVSIASAVLLVGSFYNVYLKKHISVSNPQVKQTTKGKLD